MYTKIPLYSTDKYQPFLTLKSITTLCPWCKEIQESLGFWTPRRGFRIPGNRFQSLSAELGFWILIVCGILDSLSELNSRFQNPGFQIPLRGPIHCLNFDKFRDTALLRREWRTHERKPRLRGNAKKEKRGVTQSKSQISTFRGLIILNWQNSSSQLRDTYLFIDMKTLSLYCPWVK